jgi:hypothetical protein
LIGNASSGVTMSGLIAVLEVTTFSPGGLMTLERVRTMRSRLQRTACFPQLPERLIVVVIPSEFDG